MCEKGGYRWRKKDFRGRAGNGNRKRKTKYLLLPVIQNSSIVYLLKPFEHLLLFIRVGPFRERELLADVLTMLLRVSFVPKADVLIHLLGFPLLHV